MSNNGKWSLVKFGKRERTCPVCGHRFIAKNSHFRLCAECKSMVDRKGAHRRKIRGGVL